jgi:hypothetical protein
MQQRRLPNVAAAQQGDIDQPVALWPPPSRQDRAAIPLLWFCLMARSYARPLAVPPSTSCSRGHERRQPALLKRKPVNEHEGYNN